MRSFTPPRRPLLVVSSCSFLPRPNPISGRCSEGEETSLRSPFEAKGSAISGGALTCTPRTRVLCPRNPYFRSGESRGREGEVLQDASVDPLSQTSPIPPSPFHRNGGHCHHAFACIGGRLTRSLPPKWTLVTRDPEFSQCMIHAVNPNNPELHRAVGCR